MRRSVCCNVRAAQALGVAAEAAAAAEVMVVVLAVVARVVLTAAAGQGVVTDSLGVQRVLQLGCCR